MKDETSERCRGVGGELQQVRTRSGGQCGGAFVVEGTRAHAAQESTHSVQGRLLTRDGRQPRVRTIYFNILPVTNWDSEVDVRAQAHRYHHRGIDVGVAPSASPGGVP